MWTTRRPRATSLSCGSPNRTLVVPEQTMRSVAGSPKSRHASAGWWQTPWAEQTLRSLMPRSGGVGAAAHPSPLADAFGQTRAAVGARVGTDAQRALRSALRATGITAEHGVIATLNLRVLRPGSSPATDATLGDALTVWDDAESRLELELDARAVAYAVSREGSLTLEQVYSLLWPRGRDARGQDSTRTRGTANSSGPIAWSSVRRSRSSFRRSRWDPPWSRKSRPHCVRLASHA